MAKRRGNKSAKVRELLTANPALSTREVMDTLKAQKVTVTAPLVYAIKAKMGNGAATAGSSAHGKKPSTNGYTVLLQAKKLADAMGGVDKARAALDVLAQLV